MRQHLRMCLETNQIVPFPVCQPNLKTSNPQRSNDSQLKQSFEIEIDGVTKARLRKRKQRSDTFKRDKENAVRNVSGYRQTKRKQMKKNLVTVKLEKQKILLGVPVKIMT